VTPPESNSQTPTSPRTVRIGITGPIGCGKSTVAKWLGERPGVVVIDADRVARDVLDRGEPALDAVVVRFGPMFLRSDGTLDRAALGRLVFADPSALRDLESIVHPAVRPRILTEIAEAERADAPAVVVEAIKLVEGGLAEDCDEVWLVACGRDVQRDRLVARGSDRADAEQRIAAQGDVLGRLAGQATRVIDTSGGAAETKEAALAAFDDAIRRPR
jgi:dephospho-CoA kinase